MIDVTEITYWIYYKIEYTIDNTNYYSISTDRATYYCHYNRFNIL